MIAGEFSELPIKNIEYCPRKNTKIVLEQLKTDFIGSRGKPGKFFVLVGDEVGMGYSQNGC